MGSNRFTEIEPQRGMPFPRRTFYVLSVANEPWPSPDSTTWITSFLMFPYFSSKQGIYFLQSNPSLVSGKYQAGQLPGQ